MTIDLTNLWTQAEQSRRLYRYNEDGRPRDIDLEAAILADGFHPAGNRQWCSGVDEMGVEDYQLAFHPDGRDRVYTLDTDGLISWVERPADAWYTEKVDLLDYLAPVTGNAGFVWNVYSINDDRWMRVRGRRGVNHCGYTGNYYTTQGQHVSRSESGKGVSFGDSQYLSFTADADRVFLSHDSLFRKEPVDFQPGDSEITGFPRYAGVGDWFEWRGVTRSADGSDGEFDMRMKVAGRWHTFGDDPPFEDVLLLDWVIEDRQGLFSIKTLFAREMGLIGWQDIPDAGWVKMTGQADYSRTFAWSAGTSAADEEE